MSEVKKSGKGTSKKKASAASKAIAGLRKKRSGGNKAPTKKAAETDAPEVTPAEKGPAEVTVEASVKPLDEVVDDIENNGVENQDESVVQSEKRDVVMDNLTLEHVFKFCRANGVLLIAKNDYAYVAKFSDNSKIAEER